MHQIIVSEPWDYSGNNGKNEIYGEIVKQYSSSVIMKTFNNITINSITGSILILSFRYESENQDFTTGVTVNGGIVLNEPNFKTLNEDEIKSQSKFVLIGTLRKIK